MRIVCSTRFDITATEIRSNFQAHRMPFQDSAGHMITTQSEWQRARNQQRNWETVNQIISLRALPTDISTPRVVQDRGNLWMFDFVIDTPSSVELDGNELGALYRDSAGVPMILGLDELPGLQDILVPNTNIFFSVASHK